MIQCWMAWFMMLLSVFQTYEEIKHQEPHMLTWIMGICYMGRLSMSFSLLQTYKERRYCESRVWAFFVIQCFSNLQGEKIPRTTHVDLDVGYLFNKKSYRVFQLVSNLQGEKILCIICEIAGGWGTLKCHLVTYKEQKYLEPQLLTWTLSYIVW